MLIEPIKGSLFGIQANLRFTDRNFSETKFDKDHLN